MSDGKCPKCEETIDEVRVQRQVLGNSPDDVSAFIVTCPHCRVILGFLPDSQARQSEQPAPGLGRVKWKGAPD
jgi:hypothetical protein